MRAPGSARFRATSSAVLSSVVHLGVLAALLAAARWPTRIAPMRIPGTLTGTNLLPVYSLGGAPGVFAPALPAAAKRTAAPSIRKRMPSPAPVSRPLSSPAPKAVPSTALSAATSTGVGDSGDSALGDDNVNIALVRNHPSPAPDLSVLPRGAAGDVILDIQIDAEGNITAIKLDHGLEPTIDQIVIATVRRWNFAPATRNGQPVASEQEILFHYVRS